VTDWQWFVSAIGGILAWLWSVFVWHRTQKQQRAQEDYKRKEQLYRELLKQLENFYKTSGASQKQSGIASFLQEVRLAWLYAPDNVIQALYEFLDTQREGVPDKEKNEKGSESMAKLVVAIRGDLFRTVNMNTKLTKTEFRHYT